MRRSRRLALPVVRYQVPVVCMYRYLTSFPPSDVIAHHCHYFMHTSSSSRPLCSSIISRSRSGITAKNTYLSQKKAHQTTSSQHHHNGSRLYRIFVKVRTSEDHPWGVASKNHPSTRSNHHLHLSIEYCTIYTDCVCCKERMQGF